MLNLKGRIGGDSGLSPRGLQVTLHFPSLHPFSPSDSFTVLDPKLIILLTININD